MNRRLRCCHGPSNDDPERRLRSLGVYSRHGQRTLHEGAIRPGKLKCIQSRGIVSRSIARLSKSSECILEPVAEVRCIGGSLITARLGFGLHLPFFRAALIVPNRWFALHSASSTLFLLAICS